MQICVANMFPGTGAHELQQAFNPYGTITSIETFTSGGSGVVSEFALVEMADDSKATAAIEGVKRTGISGHFVSVCEFTAPRSLLASETFRSFVKFVAGNAFSVSKEFFSIMHELARDNVQWVTTLERGEANHPFGETTLDGKVVGSRFLTLGPLEASLDWHLAKAGAAKVTAVEGYHPNYLKCLALKAAFPELPFEILEADVMRMEVAPEFDIVICYGVLYHVHEPHLLLHKLRNLSPQLLFLATQAAVDPPHPAFTRYRMGEKASFEFEDDIYHGRWYPEARNEPLDYASALNENPSFWFYPEELRRLIEKFGFTVEEWYVPDVGESGRLVGTVLALPQ